MSLSKTKYITVVDYGVGNLQSVARAIEKCGGEVRLASDSASISNADRLILPGVGAFGDGMQSLETLGLVDAIKSYANLQRPFLGICLGMQMLMQTSEEFGHWDGLGLFEGCCVGVPATGVDGQSHKIPHMGWSPLNTPPYMNMESEKRWTSTLLAKVKPNEEFYFVHSWMVQPSRPEDVLAITRYDGQVLTAVIQKEHLMGCQFHPEKSGECGLRMIEGFLSL